MKIFNNLDIMIAVFLMIFLCFQGLYPQGGIGNFQEKYSSYIALSPITQPQKYFPFPFSGILEPFSSSKNTQKKELASFLAPQDNQEQLYSMADAFFDKFLGENSYIFSPSSLLKRIDFLIAQGNLNLAQKLLYSMDSPSAKIRKQWIHSLNTSCVSIPDLDKIDKIYCSLQEQQMLFLLEKKKHLLSQEVLPQKFFEEILQRLQIAPKDYAIYAALFHQSIEPRHLEQLKALSGGNHEHVLLYAMALFLTGHELEAEEQIQKVRKKHRADALVLQAFFLKNDSKELVALFKEGLREKALPESYFLFLLQRLPDEKETWDVLESFLQLEASEVAQEVYRDFLRAHVDLRQRNVESMNKFIAKTRGHHCLKQALLFSKLKILLTPPEQYRIAAETVEQLKTMVQNNAFLFEKFQADCYSLGGDFSLAKPIYKKLLEQETVPQELKNQSVQSLLHLYLAGGEREKGLEFWQKNQSQEIEYYCRGEWQIVLDYAQSDQFQEALERLNAVLKMPLLPIQWKARLFWLKALELFHQSSYAQALSLLEIAAIHWTNTDESKLFPQERQIFQSEIPFLKFQVYLQMGQAELAYEELKILRARGNEDLIALSYLVEARFFREKRDFQNSQKALKTLRQLYPKSTCAPIALYELAINEKRRGFDGIEPALRLFSDFCRDYPQHELIFYIHWEQAHLLKDLHDFSSAKALYETLLQNYSQCKDFYLVELEWAKCALILNSKDHAAALITLTKLAELALLSPEIRLEAGFLRAFYEERNDTNKAIQLYRANVAPFLNIPHAELSEKAQYWLSKSLFYLAELLKPAKAKIIYEQIIEKGFPEKTLAEEKLKFISQKHEND